jgi:sugar diacid utilization regulator
MPDLFDLSDIIDAADTATADELVRALVRIREWRAEFAALAADLERKLTEKVGRGSFVVEGVGEVKVATDTKRRAWDNEGLTRVVVARALDERIVDESTGEYEAAHAAVARVMSECARPSWRVTPLRARGIDETEFCEVEFGALTVRLP